MLQVNLLGQFEVLHAGTRAVIPSRKAQSLLAYMVMKAGKPLRREKLAGLLWPDSAEENARSSLRHELWNLRKALDSDHAHILGDDLAVTFNPTCGFTLDILQLESVNPNSSADELFQALAAYRGELLPGFYDEWVVSERERLYIAFETRAARLLGLLEDEHLWPEVIDLGLRWISFGGWPEPAYRALIHAYAQNGDIARSVALYERLSEGLLKDLDVKPSERTTALYKRIKSSRGFEPTRPAAAQPAAVATVAPSAADFPPHPLPRVRPSNLPRPLTSFVGRKREIEEVVQLTTASRLVTISGPGGAGKTRLAIQAASRLAPEYTDGALWVDLGGLTSSDGPRNDVHISSRIADIDLVTQALAQPLRIQDLPGQSLMERVIDDLRDRKLLLILDNCEHLIVACAELIERLLGECLGITLLATSREAISIPGEKLYQVPSLSLPEMGRSDLQSILESEAASLFVERAADALIHYQPGEAEATAIAQICRSLDGIPLAIELAAARMSLLSTSEIAARLDQRFSLLTGGRRTALPRHQTLQAAIEWSYNLLTETEQTLFRRLAIFPTSFTLDGVEAICAGQEIGSLTLAVSDILYLVAHLVAKSLVQVEAGPSTRYRLLDSIHSYAWLKVSEAGETEWLSRKHAAYYVQLAEKAEPELISQDQVQWFRQLQAENGNFRAVIDWSIVSGETESALRLVAALLWFWFSYGSTREGCDLSMRAISSPAGVGYNLERARALNTAGFLLCLVGESALARRLLEESQSIQQRLNTPAVLAWTLQFLGLAYAYDQEYDRADEVFKKGLAYTQYSKEMQANNFLHFLGDVDILRGDIPRAKSTYEESVRMLRSIGSKSFLAYPLRRLGYLALRENNIETAASYFRESLEINREIGDQRALLACFISVAALAASREMPVEACRLFGFVMCQLGFLTVNLLYTDQSELDEIHSRLSAQLDKAEFESAFNVGWEMDNAQALLLCEMVNQQPYTL